MTNLETWTLIFSIGAVIASVYAIGESKKSNAIAERATSTNKKIAKRQGVIALHMAWADIHDIDPNNLITSHVVKAINALSLTASLWNHDVIEKSILYQSYWQAYKELYDQLICIDTKLPGKGKSCKDCISEDIKKAYRLMDEALLSQVLTTKV
ncbi:hypothetical protein FGM00_07215 [Aggregatimonas sangjinii]|uniref:Uncharacterized protein n=1 Tax=Aggregatimonas sangjinii TaxID=2583587 RepID=A0A5B7SRB7_9FLAO|nr:hypothetical protein [Aggregatimonas sangjinii]QCW99898.1 hypothetical protein FGM00_07215 [Aggregatimonas sangjinii]